MTVQEAIAILRKAGVDVREVKDEAGNTFFTLEGLEAFPDAMEALTSEMAGAPEPAGEFRSVQ